MVISTSSHNMQLSDDICDYVEVTFRKEFSAVAEHVVSVDARLEAIPDVRDRNHMKVVVRVDLHNNPGVVTEIRDNNLYAAVRRGARDSARCVDRQLQHSRRVTGNRLPGKFHAFGRFPAPNV